jgi:hypothetical protein
MKKPAIGDSVQIKKGVIEPFQKKFDISGWQGRILKIFTEECMECGHKTKLVSIAYDSITLRQMSDEYIKSLIHDGIGFAESELLFKEIVPVEARDTEKETEKARKELNKKYDWNY